MEELEREIHVSLKLFTGAFPEEISIPLSAGSCVRDLVARAEWKNAEGPKRKNSRVPLKDVAPDQLLVILNGRPINNLQGYDTKLEDGDTVSVFPAMAGG